MFECISLLSRSSVPNLCTRDHILRERGRGSESLIYQQKFLNKFGIYSKRIIHTALQIIVLLRIHDSHFVRIMDARYAPFSFVSANARADTMWTLASAHIGAHYTREALIRRESLYCTHVISFNVTSGRNERSSSLPSAFLARRTRKKQRDLSDAVGSWLEKFHAILSRSARPKTIALTRPPFSANALHETGNQICTRAYSMTRSARNIRSQAIVN